MPSKWQYWQGRLGSTAGSTACGGVARRHWMNSSCFSAEISKVRVLLHLAALCCPPPPPPRPPPPPPPRGHPQPRGVSAQAEPQGRPWHLSGSGLGLRRGFVCPTIGLRTRKCSTGSNDAWSIYLEISAIKAKALPAAAWRHLWALRPLQRSLVSVHFSWIGRMWHANRITPTCTSLAN